MGEKTRIGLLLFSSALEPQFGFNSDQSMANMTRAVKNMPFLRGTTDTAQALR